MIRDNAGGIPSTIIDKIFEPYFTTKFKGEGSGLGLYMAKMLIEESIGGKLDVYSHNIYTNFKITLKRKMTMMNLNLLYVEDDEEIIEDIEFFLKRHFNEIIIAQDGEEAFRYFEEKTQIL